MKPDIDEETRESQHLIADSLKLDLTGIDREFYDTVNKEPPFTLKLQTADGIHERSSFADRAHPP